MLLPCATVSFAGRPMLLTPKCSQAEVVIAGDPALVTLPLIVSSWARTRNILGTSALGSLSILPGCASLGRSGPSAKMQLIFPKRVPPPFSALQPHPRSWHITNTYHQLCPDSPSLHDA